MSIVNPKYGPTTSSTTTTTRGVATHGSTRHVPKRKFGIFE